MTRTTQTKTSTPIRAFTRILVAGLIGAAVLLPIASASAQSQWIERDEVVEKLGSKYGEQPTAMGLASNGGVMELFSTPDGATWTLVITMPNGSSRMIAAGEGWTTVPMRVAGSDL